MPLLPAQVKMFMPMGLMFFYNKFGTAWEAPPLRLAYAMTIIFSVLAYAYIYTTALKKASQTETLTVKTKQAVGPEKVEKLSIRQYDVRETRANMQQLIMGAVFVIAIHSWKGYLQPLLIQAIMGLFLLVDQPLFRIYVLGQPAVGDLQRPFKKEVSPLAAMLGQGVGDTEAAPTENENTAADIEPTLDSDAAVEPDTVSPAGTAKPKGPVRKRVNVAAVQ